VPVTALIFVLAFLPQSISMVRLYPYLLSYYSETVGGLPGANRMGMETTYWCESYAAAIPYLNEHARSEDMIWVDPLSQNVMVYYQVHGRLRDDIKIAYAPYAPTWPFVYDEYGPPTPATHQSSDFIVLQYRQTLMGSTRENPDRDVFSPHPDFQWVSEREPVYQLSRDGVPIMEIYTNTPIQVSESGLGQVFKPEAGDFTVQVPPYLVFTETIRELDTGDPALGILNAHLYQNTNLESGLYSVGYFDLPAEVVAANTSQALLNSIRAELLQDLEVTQDIEVTMIEERAVSLGDHPGGEAIIEAYDNDLSLILQSKTHYYLVQNRYYQIEVWIPKDGAFTTEMDAFLQSFEPTVQAPADWQAFKSEAGNFTVQVPPDLEFTEETLDVDSTSLHTHYANFREGNGSYGIFYYDHPAEVAGDPDVVQAMLDGHRDGWLGFIKGTPVEERALFLGNHPGREVIVEAKDNDLPVQIKARYYLMQNRFYQIEVRIPKDRTFTTEMETFLQSFELLESL
jgi:hypothetical protein